MPARAPELRDVVARLSKRHGKPERPPAADAFGLVLWENVAYLASPERRREAFAALVAEVGTEPGAVLAARAEVLTRIASRGILAHATVAKLRECARIAVEQFDGDLDAALDGPLPAAKRALRRFPGIGEPGAEKILLLSGRHPFLAPESNGLRVLVRLGLVPESSSYARTYADARALASGLRLSIREAADAHLLLQRHGQTLCRRTAPLCDECPLARECAHASAR